jgi:hexokinase
MRVLFDECVPRGLRRELSGHDVRTVPEMGWASKENGELLELAAAVFDVFITTDQKLSYQQGVTNFDIGVTFSWPEEQKSTSYVRLCVRFSSF